MDKKPIRSKTMESAAYDAATQQMFIYFKNGNIYEYYKVPPEKFTGLSEADDADTFFTDNIVDRFNWARQLAPRK
jgi:hypothetical protein